MSTMTSLSISRTNDNDDEMNDPMLSNLDLLEEQIFRLTRQKININSPKQVSTAIFGRVQSTSREILRQAAEGRFKDLSERQQTIAALVLRHRELARGQAATGTNVSSRVDVVGGDDGDDLPQDSLSAFQRTVEELFSAKSKISSYWREPLLRLARPTAQALVHQLDPTLCPMGFDPLAFPNDPLRINTLESTATATTAGKKGSFLAYCRDQKLKYPDAIILTRCGDFYETYGVDAVMLVEHCGLNAMAGKAKAGCPIRNVQATLDCLTSQGFTVAVYEEASDTDASAGAGSAGGSKSRIKNRFLAQMVSPASPTYLFDLVLSGHSDVLAMAPPSRPYVGIMSLSTGYTFVEVNAEERTVRVSERLTAEAVACRLAAYPPTDPLLYVPSVSEFESKDRSYYLPFLPSRNDPSKDGPGGRLRTRVVSPHLVQEPMAGVSDDERAKNTILSALLELTETKEDNPHCRRASPVDFVLVSANETNVNSDTQTSPLYLETATQLGLMNDPAIPSLLSSILPDSAPAATRRFLRRFLLTPPPPSVTEAMQHLVAYFKCAATSVPPLSVPPVGKILSLLRAGQASAQVYGELLQSMNATIIVLDMLKNEGSLVDDLMLMLSYESGMSAEVDSLRARCIDAMETIESVVSPLHHGRFDEDGNDRCSDYGSLIPGAFFERNELSWRGRVRRSAAVDSYELVEAKARQLAEVVALDFFGEDGQGGVDGKRLIVQDIFNNMFALREIPPFARGGDLKSNYIHPRDRFGKAVRNRYTTEKVQEAMADYVAACEQAKLDVSSALVSLSELLHDDGHIPAIVQSSHANLIASAAYYHAAKARSLGWNQAAVHEPSVEKDSVGFFSGLWPYWMDKSEAVANSFELDGMWLLTAPNMAGKSTVLRSTAAAALLSVCGLCAPLEKQSLVRRFDHIFVRGASSDVPTESKSAFGAEMGDVAALLRCCGDRSLVFVDELGRGTSPRDGTRLAGAVLEEMALTGMSGMFATHLHDILQLPLAGWHRITRKRMAIHERDQSGHELANYKWTYKLEDGVCTDSMALVTAARFGLPQRVLERAEFFADSLAAPVPTLEPSDPSANDLIHQVETETEAFDAEDISYTIETITGKAPVAIPSRWSVPASHEGQTCVYVLQFDNPRGFYVGETDNIRKRLDQHRSKGGNWSTVDAYVVNVPEGKSEARELESRLIQRLARAGMLLHSTRDGRSLRNVNRI